MTTIRKIDGRVDERLMYIYIDERVICFQFSNYLTFSFYVIVALIWSVVLHTLTIFHSLVFK